MPDTQTAAEAPAETESNSAIYGSGDPRLQEEHRAGVIERVGGEEAYLKNIDDHWTVQQGPMPATGQIAALGPQAFARSQLPDPAVARAAGVPPQQMTTGLVIDDLEEAIGHPRGPEPGEVVRLALNQATNERMRQDAEQTPHQAEHFNHTSEATTAAREEIDAEAEEKARQEAEAAAASTGSEAGDDGGPSTTSEDEVPPYSEWHKDDLVEECRNRELAVSGNKDDLVARLEEFDKNAAE